MSYFKKAITGIYWTGALRITLRGLSLVRTVILARLLTPFKLGIYGVASLSLALLETLTETGINIFLVQEHDSDKYVDTAWIVSILRGSLISVFLIATSSVVSQFFKSPESRFPILLISLVSFIRGFINPSIVNFQKHLKFNQEFKFRSILFFVEALVTISVAYFTRSPSSLIFGLIASSICEVIFSFFLLKPIPHLNFQIAELKIILHRGKWITAAGILDYLYHNADNIVVGRMLGVSSLGLYNTAYTISSLPITELSDVFSRVSFPIYAQIRNDRQRLLRAFSISTLALSTLVIPFGILLFFFPQIIIIILGKNWAPAVPALQLLSIYGVIRSISGSSSALFLAVKRAKLVTYVTLVSFLGLAIFIVPLVSRWGIMGAASSAIIGSVFALPIIFVGLKQVFSHDNYQSY